VGTVWEKLSYILSFYSSVHLNSRLKKSNKIQEYADIYFLLNYSTCFGRPSHTSSGVHKNVIAASGTVHTIWGASLSLLVEHVTIIGEEGIVLCCRLPSHPEERT